MGESRLTLAGDSLSKSVDAMPQSRGSPASENSKGSGGVAGSLSPLTQPIGEKDRPKKKSVFNTIQGQILDPETQRHENQNEAIDLHEYLD